MKFMKEKLQPPIFFLEEQTSNHLIFGSKNYDLLRSLYVHPSLGDGISAILWNYYYFLSEHLVSPLENYREWHNTFTSIYEVTEMITKPLDNLRETRPDTANLVLEKGKMKVKIFKEGIKSPIYISISSNSIFLIS